MTSKKNYNIIILYATVFIIIALITVYLPLWLKEKLLLDKNEIGYLIASVGIFKFFSNFVIIKKIKDLNHLRASIIFTSILIIICLSFITFSHASISKELTLILTIISLLIFSPILPMVETIFNNSERNFAKEYGKIRVSGSISFMLTIFLISIFFGQYAISIYPVLFLLATIILLLNALKFKPEKSLLKKINYRNDIKKLLYHKEYMFVLIICSLIQSSHAMYYSFSTILWSNIGLKIFNIGILWAIAVFAEIILFFKAGKANLKRNFYFFLGLCGVLSSIRWTATFYTESFFFLIFLQTLHAISFALTHYLIMYFINVKMPNDLKFLCQVFYHGLSGGIMLTFFIICLSLYFSYFNDNKGYLLMALICMLSFLLSFLASRIFKNGK